MAEAGARVLLASCDETLVAAGAVALYMAGYNVVAVSDSGPDALSLICELQPDIVIASMLLREKDGFWLLNRLKSLPLSNMPAVALMLPGGRKELTRRAKHAGTFAAIFLPASPGDLVYTVQQAQPMDRLVPCFAREARIREILDGLSLGRKLKGYEYLVVAIGIACRSRRFFRAMTLVVYPQTALVMGATASQVERCIRHAIETAWMRGDLERQYAYFGNTIDGNRGKPTNTEFIARITEALRLEARQDEKDETGGSDRSGRCGNRSDARRG